MAPDSAAAPTETRAALAPRTASLCIAVSGVVWVVLVFLAFTPGVMSADSVWQYYQGLTGRYDNWHPPLSSWFIGVWGRWVGSPWPALLIQLAGIAGGLGALALIAAKVRPSAALATFILSLSLPPLWSIGATLWKDVTMAVALLGCAVAILHRRWAIAAVLMVAASLFRLNGIVAVVPLLWAWAPTLPTRVTRPGRWAAALLLLMACLLAERVLERMVRAHDSAPIAMLLGWDLAGIYVRHPEAVAGSIIGEQLSADGLTEIYTPDTCSNLFWSAPNGKPLQIAPLLTQKARVADEWRSAVLRYPGAYAAHRLRSFASLLGLRAGGTFYPFQARSVDNPWKFQVPEGTALREGARWLQEATRGGPWNLGWPWLVVGFAFVAVGWRGGHRPVTAVALSGVVYASSLLIVGVAADLRYLLWTMVSVLSSALLWLSHRR